MKTEEGNLEPTPSLKLIYPPPSIKVLFPLNQCKSSFCKFTAYSIKTYTSQCNKNIHNLFDHFTCTEEDLISVTTPYKKIYGNLTLQEKSALNNLKNNQSIVIKPCDKGGGICIMNTKDYLIKIHTHLHDRNSYKPLTYNTTSAIVNDACTLIEYIHSPHTSRLWATQNSQARQPSPPNCVWVGWSN